MDMNNNVAEAKNTAEILGEAKDQFNILFSNLFQFEDEDMVAYDKCYADVFRDGPNMSYMSATFFAQFAAEIFVGLLSSDPLRRVILSAIEDERGRNPEGLPQWWDEGMADKRFGIAGRDYTEDVKDLTAMMNESYNKIATLNQWYGSEEGKKEFEMYCLSREAVASLKSIILEFPYLVRRYDYDKAFAGEIMEYASITAIQVREAAAAAGL